MCEENFNPFKMIVSVKNIAKYIGVCRNTVQCFYIKDMARMGFAWKKSNKISSAYCTFPFFIALFFHYRAIEQNLKMEKQAEHNKDRANKYRRDRYKNDLIYNAKIKKRNNNNYQLKKELKTK